MVGAAPKTREAHARDVAAFLSFLGSAPVGSGMAGCGRGGSSGVSGLAATGSVRAQGGRVDLGSRGRHGQSVLPVGASGRAMLR